MQKMYFSLYLVSNMQNTMKILTFGMPLSTTEATKNLPHKSTHMHIKKAHRRNHILTLKIWKFKSMKRQKIEKQRILNFFVSWFFHIL